MNSKELESKTAKALDKALLKVEKEYKKFLQVAAEVRETIKKHYSKSKSKEK